MAEAAGLVHCIFKDLLGIGCKFDLEVLMAALNADPLDDLTHPVRFEAKLAQHPASDSALLLHETQQQMLCTDAVLSAALGLLMG
jgi:hypothetical protein